MKIKLKSPFAANSSVDEFEVRQMKKALNRLGYYQPYEKVGITGIADTAVFAALKTFQKDYGLNATGAARPDDDTVKTLNREIAKTPEGTYIWRTVEDGQVRNSHAAFNHTIRSWDNEPDPGEDYNCRCWAEPVAPFPEIYDPPIKPLYPELYLIPAVKAKTIINLLEFSAYKMVQNFARHKKIEMNDTNSWPRPPTSGKYKEGIPSRQKPSLRGEKSLYDEKGGEWRYAKEDKYHNPHWDYKESPSSTWKNIPLDGKPILKSGA